MIRKFTVPVVFVLSLLYTRLYFDQKNITIKVVRSTQEFDSSLTLQLQKIPEKEEPEVQATPELLPKEPKLREEVMEATPELFPEKHQGRNKPFFKDAGVHILHVGDQTFAQKMGAWMNRTFEWIDCMGYTHKLAEVSAQTDEDGCIYTKKVRAILQSLLEIPENDWLIFLDMDAQYQAPTCDGLERFLLETQQKYKQKCEFIAITAKASINTGVLLLQATSFTRTIVQQWYDYQILSPVCTYSADQLALQEVVLKRFAKDYSDLCSKGSQRGRNSCFSGQLPVEQRSQGNLCLIPCPPFGNITALQCHDCRAFNGEHCNTQTAIFYHNKNGRPYIKTPPV